MRHKDRLKTVLVIAGFDPSNGAGATSDLKVIRDLGAHGVSVLTALTVQNTKGVYGVFPVKAGLVRSQLDAILDDIPVDAVKIGMLGSRAVIDVVADVLSARLAHTPVVLDPVLISSSGADMAGRGGRTAIVKNLLPLSSLVTPNLDEASVLSGIEVTNIEDMKLAAAGIVGLGAKAALVKGGHLGSGATDVLFDGVNYADFRGKRYPFDVHGTGCHLSAAIATHLAIGWDLKTAIRKSRRYLGRLFRDGVITPGSGSPCFK